MPLTLVTQSHIDTESAIALSAQIINAKILDIFERFEPDDDGELELNEAIKYFVSNGGKCLRGFVTLECAKIFNFNVTDVLPFAVAMELVHAYSLIYDDLPSIDNADFRRDKQVMHKKFSESTAILAGSALLTHAFRILANDTEAFSHQARLRVVSELSNCVGIMGMIGGQALDLILLSKKDTQNDEFVRMNRKKTGALFSFASSVGSMISHSNHNIYSTMQRFGYDIGLMYQILDDIHDISEDVSRGLQKVSDKELAIKQNFVSHLGGKDGAIQYIKMLQEKTKLSLLHSEIKTSELSTLLAFVDYIADII